MRCELKDCDYNQRGKCGEVKDAVSLVRPDCVNPPKGWLVCDNYVEKESDT